MEIQELANVAYLRHKVEKLAKNRLSGRGIVDPREINLELHTKQIAQTVERTRFYMCMYEDARQYDELMSKEIVEAAKHSYMLKNISFKMASKETAKIHLDSIAHMFKQAGELKLPYNKNKRVIK